MSSTNGTVTVEMATPLVADVSPLPVVVETLQVEASPQTELPAPSRPVSALDEAQRWYEDVVRLCDGLAEEEAALLEKLTSVRVQLARFRRVVAIFVDPAETEAPSAAADMPLAAPAGERRRSPAPLTRWSRKHDACVQCGRSDRKHKARGRCGPCYDGTAAFENKEHTS